MDVPPPQRWDRGKWVTVFSSHSPTIREVTECLGLGLSPSASTTNRGIPKFDAPEFKKLSSEVTRLSKELPQDRDRLLDFAANPNALEKELDELLESLGPQIWGKDADRSRLVTPDAGKKTYYKHLFYEDPEDQDILKIHLQRWIVIKACYYIRNRKLKKHAGGEDYETVADIEAVSPVQQPDPPAKLLIPSLRANATPPQTPVAASQSNTPSVKVESTSLPSAEAGDQRHINPQKRKSSDFTSPDGEDSPSSISGPRKRPYQNSSLPIQRKSPRKSLTSRISTENIPPSPSLHLQPPAHAGASTPPAPNSDRLNSDHTNSDRLNSDRPNPDRPLSPLANNSLNGAPRPASTAPSTAPSAFAPVSAPTSSSAAASPSTFASAATASPSTFTAISTPDTSAPPPSSSFAAVNAPGHSSANTTPAAAFATVNPPSGFTAVNTAGSTNVPIAPNPQSYARSYSTGDPARPDTHMAMNSHNEPILHRRSAAQREPSPQKQPTVQSHHRPDVLPNPDPRSSGHPVAPHGPHQSQQAFHTHSIPPANIVQNIQPKYHPYAMSNGNGLANAPILPSNMPNRPAMNGHIAEHRPPVRAPSPPDITLLQCELLPLLIRYFFPRDGPRLDETVLLQNLDYIWHLNEPTFRAQLGALYETQTRILYAWMEERRKIQQLQHAMDGQPGVRCPEMVDRLLAMNDLRVMRLKWKAMKTQDGNLCLAPEDLLCRTFALMTKTEGTEGLFKEGLERLNECVFEFLRSEDMKISMSKR